MKKNTFILMSLLALFILTSCGAKVDDATAEKYITKAEEVVELLNNKEYEELIETLDSEMKAGLTESELKELEPVIEQSGEFETIEKSSVEEKDGLYVVVLAAKYSDEKRVYTISFNKDDETSGLYIK